MYSNIDKIYDYVVLQTTDQYALKITVSLELKPPKTKQNGLRSTNNMHHDVTQYFVVVFILIIEKKRYINESIFIQQMLKRNWNCCRCGLFSTCTVLYTLRMLKCLRGHKSIKSNIVLSITRKHVKRVFISQFKPILI